MNYKFVVLSALVASLMICARANATFTLFTTPAGSTVTDGAVNASVSFTTLNNEVQITLQNLGTDPKSVGENLSALVFTLDSGQHAGSIISSLGLERTVSAGGTYSDGSNVAAGWVLSGVGGSLQLDVLSGSGHAGPAHTVIGAPDGSNKYGNANASIAGNGPHNPFLAGPVTFDLSIPGVTSGSKVSMVQFQFGTTDGSNQIAVTQSSTAVPEPGALGVVVVGAAISLFRRRVA
jgi:hypothetical protein